jgi:GDP-L-fucose synthase
MPTNLWNHDNFDLTSSVLPAMMRKFHEGKWQCPVTLGEGNAMREFLFDMAHVVFALENTLPDYLYNVGTGEDLTIKQLAETIQITGHQGEIIWDATKPDGIQKEWTYPKCMHWDGNTKRRRNSKTYTIGFRKY